MRLSRGKCQFVKPYGSSLLLRPDLVVPLAVNPLDLAIDCCVGTAASVQREDSSAFDSQLEGALNS